MSQEANIPIQKAVTIGTTATDVMDDRRPNGVRRQFIIQNTSPGGGAVAYVGLGVDAVTGVGKLDPGQSVVDSTDLIQTCWQGRVSVVFNIAGGTVSVQEWVV